MRIGRILAALAIVSGGIILGIATNDDILNQPGQMPTDVAVEPPQIPPEPNVTRSRDEEGGPENRRAFEIMRLADPVTGELPKDIFLKEQIFAERLPVRSAPVATEHLDKANFDGWIYRGPHNIGGRTRAFALDVSDLSYQTFLAGGVSGGMWRTTDEGLSWVMTTGSSQLHSVTSVAQDTRPGKENVWYYSTGEYVGNSAYGGGNAFFQGDGIFKSTDSGVTWTQLASTAGGTPGSFNDIWQYTYRVAIDPTNLVEDEVYAALFGQIMRSVDGGVTWNAVLGTYNPWSAYTDVMVSPTGVVYATLSTGGGQAGIFRSTDGITWADITPSGLTNFGRIIMALAPSNENIMYTFVSDIHGTTSEGFYRYDYLSGDGSGAGGTWNDRSANLSSLPGGYYGSYTVNTQSNYCQSLAVKPDDPNTVFLGGVELTRSTDGFATRNNTTWVGGWTYTNQHADQHWMFFLPGSNSIAYTGSDGGVHKTWDANASTVSWVSMNNGYNTSQFYTVAIDEFTNGSDVVIGGTQDSGTQWANAVNPTGNWIRQWSGDGSYCAVVNVNWSPGEYYLSSQNGKVNYRGVYSDGTTFQWTRLDPTGGGNYLFINPFILDPNDDNMMYIASDNGVWRNHDLRNLRNSNMYSNSTQTLYWSHLTTLPAGDPISALAVTRNGARTLYYGTASGSLYRVDNSHTAPAGTVPAAMTAPAVGYVSSIAVDPNDDQRILVAYSNYSVQSMWLSNDGGSTWVDIEGNLGGPDGPSVRSLKIMYRAGYEMWFAATSVGLYSTVDQITTWEREADTLIGTVVVDDITTRAADGLVVVGTHGRGIYSIAIPEGVVAAEILTLEGAERTDDGVEISWLASSALHDHQVYVYREQGENDWLLLNKNPLFGYQTSFVDITASGEEAVYRLKLISPTGTETWHGPVKVGGTALGSRFSLAPARPNPFRVESALYFNLPRSGNVSVSIYDIRGHLVRTLTNEVLSEGAHHAVWDGRTDGNVRAAAGVYYAKVKTDDGIKTEKMVLMK